MSKIEWTGRTWNPIVGCSAVSPGCKNCYAARMSERLARIATTADLYEGLTRRLAGGQVQFTGVLRVNEKAITKPMAVKRPTLWFVNSMSDLFHEGVSSYDVARIVTAMSVCPQHTFQVLTKRPERMREMFTDRDPEYGKGFWWEVFLTQGTFPKGENGEAEFGPYDQLFADGTYLKNVWLGTSVESQATAAERIPHLLATPAAVRFLSMEPLLDRVNLNLIPGAETLDWVIVGGESGPGSRPMNPHWVIAIREFCREHNIPFFFKQWGRLLPEVAAESAVGGVGNRRLKDVYYRAGSAPMACYDMGKKNAGRLLFGQTYDAMPPLYHTTV